MTATVNERLRTAMLRTGTTTDDLALCCGVDLKTSSAGSPWAASRTAPPVGRRTPPRRRRGMAVARRRPGARAAGQSELVQMYPDRASVPRETWLGSSMDGARGHRRPGHVRHVLRPDPAQGRPHARRGPARGVRVRLCFGDPDGEAVAIRGREEGIGDTLAAKIRSVADLLPRGRRIRRSRDATARLHPVRACSATTKRSWSTRTPWASPPAPTRRSTCAASTAARSPRTTWTSFERVWDTAKPWTGEDV